MADSHTQSPPLSGVIALFDRKERRHVVSRALGASAEKLDEGFCNEISSALQDVRLTPESTRWFTDFHLDWLAGALHVYAKGEQFCPGEGLWANSGEAEHRLVCGNQEDIDLLLVQGNDLILVEAKWFGSWDDEQLKRKLGRIATLRKCIASLCAQTQMPQVRIRFVFLSPIKPPDRTQNIWTEHGGGEPLCWIKLEPPSERCYALRVVRWSPNPQPKGKSAADGTHWRLEKISMPKSSPSPKARSASTVQGCQKALPGHMLQGDGILE